MQAVRGRAGIGANVGDVDGAQEGRQAGWGRRWVWIVGGGAGFERGRGGAERREGKGKGKGKGGIEIKREGVSDCNKGTRLPGEREGE